MKTSVIIGGILLGVGLLGWLLQPTSLEETVTQAAAVQASVDQRNGPASPDQQQLSVPDFTVQTTAGETVTLSDLVADKPTMVGFWASWCHNCQRNLPAQNELFQAYKDQVNIVEVNLRERVGAVDRYANDKNYDFHMAYDVDGTVSNAWGVQYTNTHFLIGANGELIDAFPGDITEDHFRQLIASNNTTVEGEEL